MASSAVERPRKHILSSLPDASWSLIQAHLEAVDLPEVRANANPGARIDFVDFPDAGVGPVTLGEPGDLMAEAEMFGREGFPPLSSPWADRRACTKSSCRFRQRAELEDLAGTIYGMAEQEHADLLGRPMPTPHRHRPAGTPPFERVHDETWKAKRALQTAAFRPRS